LNSHFFWKLKRTVPPYPHVSLKFVLFVQLVFEVSFNVKGEIQRIGVSVRLIGFKCCSDRILIEIQVMPVFRIEPLPFDVRKMVAAYVLLERL